MSIDEKPPEDRIRERAYALWEEDGRPEGRSEDYWNRARAELEAEADDPTSPLVPGVLPVLSGATS